MPMTLAPDALKSNNASMVESTTITTTPAATTTKATTATTTDTTSSPNATDSIAIPSTIDDDVLLSPTSTSASAPPAPTASATATPEDTAELNRSASSNDLPTISSTEQTNDHPLHLRKAFSEIDLAHPTTSNDAAAAAAAHHNARARAQSAADITAPPRRRASVLFTRDRQKSLSNITGSRNGQSSPPSTAGNQANVKSPDPNGGEKPGKSRSFFASLTRRPWRALSSPRSTSPSSPTAPCQLGGSSETLHTVPNGDAANGVPVVPAVPDAYRSFTPVPQSPVTDNSKQWVTPAQAQAQSQGHEKGKDSVSSAKNVSTKRPGSRGRGNSTANGSNSTTGRFPGSASGVSTTLGEDEGTFRRPEALRQNSSKSIRAKMSLERLAASVGASTATDVPPVPPTPTISTSGIGGRGFAPSMGNEASAKKRDELWGAFRTLDNDLAKFRSKAGNLRANFMRNNVLPMLHRCANHPSNNNLRPEDLDRRANILNKWWTVLLEALNGGQSQITITNADRPLYFEAIVAIMTRPEFKYPFLPTSPKSPANSDTLTSPGGLSISNEASSGSGSASAKGTISRSKTSLESEGSDFLTESIYHNVRNILVQNLLSQLAFCIDRMSMRHCSASLVSFSARTCAYAFVCCPDVADVLVHLWNVNPDGLRRVVAMYDPDHNMKERMCNSEEIASNFPPAVRPLSFTSHVATVRWLRKRAIPPIAASQINWFGPWKTRWAGGETDLFFLFAKYYYLLVAEFISIPSLPKPKLLYIPGLVLINTQILKVLEKTLTRSTNPVQEDKSGSNGQVTFDDLIDAAETTATSPLGTANSLRQMSENRLLLLLRDVIADPHFSFDLRLMFVESICDLLKTVTRKTSLFDHNACFVLMDLAQEFVTVIASYSEQVNRPDLVDWDFWLNVFVQMLQSNNSLTEVRAFAFWFTMWDSVCATEKYKERLCMDLLLEDSTFYRYFNHWSAMVRAYFHRLLCWRVARYSGDATPLDQKIFTTLQRKLSIIYDFCISYQNRAPLVTAPSQPAPGRQLMIVKNELLFNQSSFICLDHSFSPPSPEASPPPKKRWNALRNIFSSPTNPKPGEVTPPGSRGSDQSSDSSDTPRASISDNTQRPGTSRGRNRDKLHSVPLSSFRFSLEWVERPPWNGQNPLLFPPTVPMPLRIYLQSLNQKTYSLQPRGTASDQAAAMLAAVNLNGTLRNGAFPMAAHDMTQPSNALQLVTPSGSETSEAATSSKTSSSASDATTKSDSDKENISADECNTPNSATDIDAPGNPEQRQSIGDDNTVKCTTESRPPTPDTPKNPTSGEQDSAPTSTAEQGTENDGPSEDIKTAIANKEREKYHEIQEDFLLQYSPDVKRGVQSPFRRAGSQRMHNLGKSPGASKYAGRSLSEWAHVVNECDTHYERRREAGIATNRMVEIPSLGVENFRK